jgi:hypothetical protein
MNRSYYSRLIKMRSCVLRCYQSFEVTYYPQLQF